MGARDPFPAAAGVVEGGDVDVQRHDVAGQLPDYVVEEVVGFFEPVAQGFSRGDVGQAEGFAQQQVSLQRLDGVTVGFAEEQQGGHSAEHFAVAQFGVGAAQEVDFVNLVFELARLHQVAEQRQPAVAGEFNIGLGNVKLGVGWQLHLAGEV
ncbi:hypothetical protein DRH29_03950 [candidate division Kazan bacterium]|uniref:Uncharacterized protein n=1 Tax=candidate division Kazan bacterium TaxID=2202143 RepID=A0A420ZBX0_UNCK3|nr:MAG: hypothetical protein DRH29_03950 [candidate division Kazan bacterium]